MDLLGRTAYSPAAVLMLRASSLFIGSRLVQQRVSWKRRAWDFQGRQEGVKHAGSLSILKVLF